MDLIRIDDFSIVATEISYWRARRRGPDPRARYEKETVTISLKNGSAFTVECNDASAVSKELWNALASIPV